MASITPPILPAGAIPATASAEWRRNWHQPIIGMIGLAGAAIFTYSAGVFMGPITQQFGWSRAQFSFGLTLWSVFGLITAPIYGRVVDRFGPRPVAVVGVPATILYLSAFGAIDHEIWRWWALCAGLALILPMLGPTVWIAAVSRNFTTRRGLAFALALSGSGLAAALWPIVAAYHVTSLGWRLAFPAIAFSWGAVALPLVLFSFARSPATTADAILPCDASAIPEAGVWQALFSRTFLLLAAGGGIFAMLTLAMTMHMVPILHGAGMPLIVAAAIAGLIGLFSMVGRLVTGFLLDRFPATIIGGGALLMPAASSLLLIFGEGKAGAISAVIILGLAQGAELDVITFVAARRSSAARFAGLYSILIAIFTTAAGCGPIAAGWLYDHTGGYTVFLFATLPLFVVGSLMVACAEPLGRFRRV